MNFQKFDIDNLSFADLAAAYWAILSFQKHLSLDPMPI